MNRNVPRPECLDTCSVWSLMRDEFRRRTAVGLEHVETARKLERFMLQQEHESDGYSLPQTLVRDAEFRHDMEIARLGAVSVEMRTRAVGCTESPCALAKFCVEQAIAQELRDTLSQ